MTAFDGTFLVEGQVRDEWIDINDHMNVAWYVLAFDLAIDELWQQFGIDEDYVRQRGYSTFAVESHVAWIRELKPAAPYVVTTELLAFDEKRIHQFMRMYHRDEGYLAATSEWMNLHVDLSVRRVHPWPHDILEGLQAFAKTQSGNRVPDGAGSRMKVQKPLYQIHAAYPGVNHDE